ncbi:MAG: sigma-70 family RNA polymerase sigma factor [Pseudonocardia sp.]
MTMPRTPAQLHQAALDAERWLDSLDPDAISSPDADASDLRRIGRAVVDGARVEAELAEAVAGARANGRSWGQIAAILGVSRQSARERFGDVAAEAAAPAPREPSDVPTSTGPR